MTTLLKDLISPDNVLLSLQAKDKDEVLEAMVGHLSRQAGLSSALQDKLLRCIKHRERIGATNVGRGVALPHTLECPELRDYAIVVARIDGEGIPFGPYPNDQPVRLLFMLTGPKRCQQQHQVVYALLGGLLRDRQMREALFTAPSPQAFVDVLDGNSTLGERS